MRLPTLRASRAVLARVLFAMHGFLTIWRAVVTYGDPMFWTFALLLLMIFLEGAIMITQRGGNETRWFCPSIFLYLSAVVPPIWFLELRISERMQIEGVPSNLSAMEDDFFEDEGIRETVRVADGFELYIPLKQEKWPQILEQTLLVTLIIGRWILPKGEITREQLSQLLLGHLATAADCVDFFEVFKEPEVRLSKILTFVVLGSWSVSLLQYPLVLATPLRRAVTGHRIYRFLGNTERPDAQNSPSPTRTKQRPVWLTVLRNINLWGIIVSVILQDLPFLIIRLYILSYYNVISYTMIFFTCKNTLICLLQAYRLTAVCHEESRRRRQSRDALSASESAPVILASEMEEAQMNQRDTFSDIQGETLPPEITIDFNRHPNHISVSQPLSPIISDLNQIPFQNPFVLSPRPPVASPESFDEFNEDSTPSLIPGFHSKISRL